MTESPVSQKNPLRAYLGEAFSMPVFSPELVPPPYIYKDNRMLNILFRSDADVIESLVPYPLKADLSQPLLFYIGRLVIANYASFTYNEAAVAVPVLDPDGKPGFYPLVLYLNHPNPIVGGREIYGYPKKEAEQISFDERNGVIYASVTRYGVKIIQAAFEVQQKVDPIPPRPTNPWYLLKYIPPAVKNAPPDVLKLIGMGFDPYILRELKVGQGTLEFGRAPDDIFLTKIPIREVVYSEFIVSDFSMDDAWVVHDYLKE
jgi:acetoacetate decarboxylase